jgi:hypothetical protein
MIHWGELPRRTPPPRLPTGGLAADLRFPRRPARSPFHPARLAADDEPSQTQIGQSQAVPQLGHDGAAGAVLTALAVSGQHAAAPQQRHSVVLDLVRDSQMQTGQSQDDPQHAQPGFDGAGFELLAIAPTPRIDASAKPLRASNN